MSLGAEAISVEVGRQSLIRDVTLTLSPGVVIAVVGPNGAGKSTLLGALAGDRRLSTGRVMLAGRPIGDWSARERARYRAVLAQTATVAFPFSVEDVVLLGGLPHRAGRVTGRDRSIAASALRLVGCEQLSRRNIATLSGGERQRVHLARVVVQLLGANVEPMTPREAAPLRSVDQPLAEPRDGRSERAYPERYLLLDEPTAALDLVHQQQTIGIVRALARQGVGVLVVIHDLNLAAAVAHQIVVMRDGAIVTVGRPADVLRADLIREVFDQSVEVIGHPADPSRPVVLAAVDSHPSHTWRSA